MIKKIILILLVASALWSCSKPDATPIELQQRVIIVKEYKDLLGRFITWTLPPKMEKYDFSSIRTIIEETEPTPIYTIKGFSYEEGYRYILPVKVQIENGQESYSYFEWGGHVLIKDKITDGGAK